MAAGDECMTRQAAEVTFTSSPGSLLYSWERGVMLPSGNLLYSCSSGRDATHPIIAPAVTARTSLSHSSGSRKTDKKCRTASGKIKQIAVIKNVSQLGLGRLASTIETLAQF